MKRWLSAVDNMAIGHTRRPTIPVSPLIYRPIVRSNRGLQLVDEIQDTTTLA